MLYKVTVGEDVYLGTPEEIVGFMAKAEGAPSGGIAGYMRGVAARVAKKSPRASVDASSPSAFLESLAAARLLRMEARREPSTERVDPRSALGRGPIAFGKDVSLDDLRRDVLSDEE